MAKYIVQGLKGFDFTDKEGNDRKGATLYYIDEPIEHGLMRGYIPFHVTVDMDSANKIKQFPCVCDIEFKRVPDSKGRAIEVFKCLEYIEPALIGSI